MNIDETGNTRMVAVSHRCFRVEDCGDGRSMARKVVSDLPLPSKGKRERERGEERERERERKREGERERGKERERERGREEERERERRWETPMLRRGVYTYEEGGGARPTPRGGWCANLPAAKARRRVAVERLSSAC